MTIILGILASILVMNVSSGLKDAKTAVLRDELQYMRTQISLYRATHAYAPGVSPVDGQASEGSFVSQMTRYSDSEGNTSESREGLFRFGVYLTQMPTNPMNGKSNIKLLAPAEPCTADDTTGWLYKPETLEFYANCAEYGPQGLNW